MICGHGKPNVTYDVVRLSDGVTYEIPVKQPVRYRTVVEIVNVGNGVTYEIANRVPQG